MSELVSIIVPCYKQAHFLSEALQSVLAQTHTDWECIIVNDGSPDNTEDIAKEWCNKDMRFSYLYKENGGLPSARNAGIKISKGEFILVFDSDDILHENYLSKVLPVLKSDKSLGIVSCYREFFEGKKSNIIYRYKAEGTTYHALMFENILMPSSLFRKKCWELVGGYDENMTNGFEDWEFWVAITKQGWNFKFVEEFLFYYRRTKHSMLTDTLQYHRITNMEYVFKKHKDLYIKHFDSTLDYMFFLANLYRNSETKLQTSLEYKIGNLFLKPFKLLNKLKTK
ncbi:glycosyltransferase family 2 protein [Mariniflexile sp.]|uniref:glycosyltransferase family 2 protein n=1 Tax=Mariniflexile sp. TaxID=1979402 RepID=UPI003563558F